MCVCLNIGLWCVCDVLYRAVWCVLLLLCVCAVSKRVCVFVCGLLRDVVWYVVCAAVCVLFFLCLCGLCVIECAMVYGVLLLTGCTRVD